MIRKSLRRAGNGLKRSFRIFAGSVQMDMRKCDGNFWCVEDMIGT